MGQGPLYSSRGVRGLRVSLDAWRHAAGDWLRGATIALLALLLADVLTFLILLSPAVWFFVVLKDVLGGAVAMAVFAAGLSTFESWAFLREARKRNLALHTAVCMVGAGMLLIGASALGVDVGATNDDWPRAQTAGYGIGVAAIGAAYLLRIRAEVGAPTSRTSAST